MIRLYIAGPMSGLPDFNYPAFTDAAARLRELGYEVESPHEVDVSDVPEDERTWEMYMRRTIPMVCRCHAVALLDGWQESTGAKIERRIALELGMRVRSAARWEAVAVNLDPVWGGVTR